MRTMFTRIIVLAAFVAVFGTSASVFAQVSQSSQLAAAAPQTRRLTADEAVRLALENNLGIRVARIDPQIEDLNIVNAKTGWTPNFSTWIERATRSGHGRGQLVIIEVRIVGRCRLRHRRD